MVKGINRNIIEIAETGNEVFERAILIVRPDSTDKDASTLEAHARRYLGGLRPRRIWVSRRWPAVVLRYLGAAGVGSLITWLVLQL
ncbi:MAG TPA: hypothetical protein GX499_01855 [Clostridiales bacterium]|nr:hypothetical protein [Clostridiales bacterium]